LRWSRIDQAASQPRGLSPSEEHVHRLIRRLHLLLREGEGDECGIVVGGIGSAGAAHLPAFDEASSRRSRWLRRWTFYGEIDGLALNESDSAERALPRYMLRPVVDEMRDRGLAVGGWNGGRGASTNECMYLSLFVSAYALQREAAAASKPFLCRLMN